MKYLIMEWESSFTDSNPGINTELPISNTWKVNLRNEISLLSMLLSNITACSLHCTAKVEHKASYLPLVSLMHSCCTIKTYSL